MTAALDATDAGTCAVCEAPRALREPLFSKDGHAIERCPACGLVARAELPTRADLEAIYGAAYFDATQADGAPAGATGYLAYVADEEFHRATAGRRLDRLAAEPGARLLDVGAAAGFFVDEARLRGLEARGVDVAPSMVEWGREHLGAPLRRGTLQDDDGDGSLDVITMWDYLEHTIDPAGDLRAAARLLRPGGRLVLSTGDAGALLARASLRRWHLMTPRHHNFFFSRDTLRLLLGRTGFQVREVRARGGVYPLRYVLHRSGLLDAPAPLSRLPAALAATRAGELGLPLNLFDIVTVEATRSAADAGQP